MFGFKKKEEVSSFSFKHYENALNRMHPKRNDLNRSSVKLDEIIQNLDRAEYYELYDKLVEAQVLMNKYVVYDVLKG